MTVRMAVPIWEWRLTRFFDRLGRILAFASATGLLWLAVMCAFAGVAFGAVVFMVIAVGILRYGMRPGSWT